MSSIVSNMMIERTLSQSQSHFAVKTFRTVEDEIIGKINSSRFKIPQIKERLEERIRTSSKAEDCTIHFKELNKTVHYESPENLDKLMKYLSYLSEMKHTIPDLFHTPALNNVFSRNFGSTIDGQKGGLLQKNLEHYDKLKKLVPSRKYLGVFIPNVDFKDIDSILQFIILQEFIMVSDKNARLNSDNLVIEIEDELPQHISIFDPLFNTLAVHANEKERHIYLLFLSDVYELLDPVTMELPEMSKMDIYDSSKRAKYSRTDDVNTKYNKTVKVPKYENLRTSLPDISLDQVQKFVSILDSDNDYRINMNDVQNLIAKHKIAWEEDVVPNMFNEIFEKRSVIVETQRRNPIDAYEIFHAIRYKYKKDPETQQWNTISRPYREKWLLVLGLLDIGLPKFALPALQTKPLLCNYEVEIAKGVPKNEFGNTQKFIVKEPKPEILKKQYKPEADILIQNTQHIMELYIDDRDHNKAEDSQKSAFQTLVNAKFKDVTRKTEYQTVDFNTQAYYKEALKLSMNPETYLNEKINPLYKFMPVKKDYSYNQQQPHQEFDSLKDIRSGMNSDDAEMDDSVEANQGSKRITMYSIRDPLGKTKSTKSFGVGTMQTLAQANTPINEVDPKIYGSDFRKTTLCSSIKQRTHSPQNAHSNNPIFFTSFKIYDNETLRMQKAKLEPIVDAYNPPKLHQFRDNLPPEDKKQFQSNWKREIPEVFTEVDEETLRKQASKEQEYYRKLINEMRAQRGLDAWVRYYKLAPRERGFVDFRYPDFLEKGSYTDGYVNGAPFIRESDNDIPFKLFHRSLRKTDKNLFFGDTPSAKI